MKNEKLNLKIKQGHTNLQILNEFLQMFVSHYRLTVLTEKNLASFHSNIKAKNIQRVLKKIGPGFDFWSGPERRLRDHKMRTLAE